MAPLVERRSCSRSVDPAAPLGGGERSADLRDRESAGHNPRSVIPESDGGVGPRHLSRTEASDRHPSLGHDDSLACLRPLDVGLQVRAELAHGNIHRHSHRAQVRDYACTTNL